MKTPIKHNITSYDPKDGVLVDASNSSIARVGRTNQAQNIAQIIRAVNYHEMLLEALKSLLLLVECETGLPQSAANGVEACGIDEGVVGAAEILNLTRAAIAAAEGK